MSTFLQLCQQVHRKLRIGDYDPGSRPLTVVGQTGDLGDVVASVQEAWTQLQMHHPEWRWLKSHVNATLTAGDNIITVADFRLDLGPRFAHIVPYVAQAVQRYANVRDIGAITNPDNRCYFIPWQEYTGWWDRKPTPQNAMPFYFSEHPNRDVYLYPAPNVPPSGTAWQFSVPCRLTPQSLAADSDTPEMPAEFHNIIVWWAVDIFCRTRTNFDRLSAEAKREVNRQLFRLAADQLPEMTDVNRYV